jgi:tRNA (mo5U34)-methyltransferase
MHGNVDRAAAAALCSEDVVWYQRFALAPGVFTPGDRDVGWILDQAGIPDDLTGRSVLDIGTTNGGVAFEAERRGAGRVVATDIYPPDRFGFDRIAKLLRSRVEFRVLSVYDLSSAFEERFDLIFFLGVLYHLRHPLLALDAVRETTAAEGQVFIETEVADHALGALAPHALVQFFRLDELGGDGSNWFAPSIQALLDWCWSSGLEPHVVGRWPAQAVRRCLVRAGRTPGDPEFVAISYETPLSA